MKILSASQIREADSYTIAHEPIKSIDLMERAASACIPAILKFARHINEYAILCGKGNNGGDGLAIARLMAGMNYAVKVYVIEYRKEGSPDFETNLERLKDQGKAIINHISNVSEVVIDPNSIIIDAILGTGINKPAEGLVADVINMVNKRSGQQVLAIDVPSGMMTDELSPKKAAIIQAKLTLTFQQPKLAYMFSESADYVGEFEVLDLQLDTSFLPDGKCLYFFTQSSDIAPQLKDRPKFSHKGTFGHSLIIAGGYGKMGAAVLSARACLHSGTGLLTVHIPKCGYEIMQTSLPEAMIDADTHEDHIGVMPELMDYRSVGIGPGIGKAQGTAEVLKKVIQNVDAPMVIDADALNILSENKTWLSFLRPLTILTPHPKEFDRLTRVHKDSWERLDSAKGLARKNKVVIVLKGAHTAVVSPDGSVWFNSTGNPALAKGGSGDVLTGILTALLSRGYSPLLAAIMGVYIHGLAADIGVRTINAESFSASDIISRLSGAFDQIYREKKGS